MIQQSGTLPHTPAERNTTYCTRCPLCHHEYFRHSPRGCFCECRVPALFFFLLANGRDVTVAPLELGGLP